MNIEILKKHVRDYKAKYVENPVPFQEDMKQRKEQSKYYGQFTKEKINTMTSKDPTNNLGMCLYMSVCWL